MAFPASIHAVSAPAPNHHNKKSTEHKTKGFAFSLFSAEISWVISQFFLQPHLGHTPLLSRAIPQQGQRSMLPLTE